MLATTEIASYGNPIDFRKKNSATKTLDSKLIGHLKYLPTDDNLNRSVMLFVGSPINSKRTKEEDEAK